MENVIFFSLLAVLPLARVNMTFQQSASCKFSVNSAPPWLGSSRTGGAELTAACLKGGQAALNVTALKQDGERKRAAEACSDVHKESVCERTAVCACVWKGGLVYGSCGMFLAVLGAVGREGDTQSGRPDCEPAREKQVDAPQQRQ